jgi:hypothetical protein
MAKVRVGARREMAAAVAVATAIAAIDHRAADFAAKVAATDARMREAEAVAEAHGVRAVSDAISDQMLRAGTVHAMTSRTVIELRSNT